MLGCVSSGSDLAVSLACTLRDLLTHKKYRSDQFWVYFAPALVGLSFAQKLGSTALPCEQKAVMVVMLASLGAGFRSIPDVAQELAKVVLNAVCFVVPILAHSYTIAAYQTTFGVLLFALAGVGIGADRHSCLFGFRRENWFHYMIAVSAVMLAVGLG